MAELKPFVTNAIVTLKIGGAEWTKTVPLMVPLSMEFDPASSRGILSAETDQFHAQTQAPTDWFSACPDGSENG